MDREFFRNELRTRLGDLDAAIVELGAMEDVAWAALHDREQEQVARLILVSVRAREAAVCISTRPAVLLAPVGSAHPR